MWQRVSQRLTDPVTYRKHWGHLIRVLRPPRAPRPVALSDLLNQVGEGPALGVFAHPDDEIFASGLICELSDRGIPVHLACLTRGEGGPIGDGTREGLGGIREQELRASAAALGAGPVTFLGHVDPLGKSHRVFAPPVSVPRLSGQLRDLIATVRPALVITHGSGGEYWHPAHLLTHAAVLHALGGGGSPRVSVLTIRAWRPGAPLSGMMNRDDPADLVLDGSRHRDRRLDALRAHHSQAGYFETQGGGAIEGFLDLTELESYRLYPAARLNAPDQLAVSTSPAAGHRG